jgi:hypothetical protein
MNVKVAAVLIDEPQSEPSSEYTFTMVPAHAISFMWKEIFPLLEPAIERSHGRWTLTHVFDALYSGQQQLWIGYVNAGEIKFALTTEVANYPNARKLAIHFLGGDDYDEWGSDMTAMLERFAKDAGCSGVEAVARFGFWPMFKDRGYKRPYVTYELNF